jgi:hypothetical protein
MALYPIPQDRSRHVHCRENLTLAVQNVSILGGHSIGHSKQKLYMYMYSTSNGFRDRAISLYSSKTVDKKEISDKVGTVYLV